ncbi:MAG: DUF4215 domain-containing protein [Myxococcota bacterium]
MSGGWLKGWGWVVALLLMMGLHIRAEAGEGVGAATCGNAVLDAGETCDDGNLTAGDGCSALCLAEASIGICGDYKLALHEQCDDGNTLDNDGCSASCQDEDKVATCGNAVLESGEQCDDGNLSNTDVCSAQCVLTPKTAQIAFRRTLGTAGVGAGMMLTGTVFPPLTGLGAVTLLVGPSLAWRSYLGPYAVNPDTVQIWRGSQFVGIAGVIFTSVGAAVGLLEVADGLFTGGSYEVSAAARILLVGGGLMGISVLGFVGCTVSDLLRTKAATERVNRILSLPEKLRPPVPRLNVVTQRSLQEKTLVSLHPILVPPLPDAPGTTVGLMISVH